jgi:C-terminal processing protease CtpA/Prc
VALELFDDPAIARLRVRAFDGGSFLSTLDRAFRDIEDRGVTALILDLRGNGGGVDDYGARLDRSKQAIIDNK